MRAIEQNADARRRAELTPYEEYVRGLDELPVLRDTVELPRRPLPADFRAGQRPDVRKTRREDALAVREAEASEREARYVEYVAYRAAAQQRAQRTKRRRKKGRKKGRK